MCLVRPVRSSRGASDWRSARIGAAPGVAGMRQPTYLVFTCLSLEAAAARASTRRRRRYAVDAVSDSSLKSEIAPRPGDATADALQEPQPSHKLAALHRTGSLLGQTLL